MGNFWKLLLILTVTIIVDSKQRNLNIGDIKELKDAINQATSIMEMEAKYEDIIICIGLPRAGKSTLINYLIGNKLIGERNFQGSPITISKMDDSPGPAIGSGSTSRTTFPTRWISKHFPGMSLWDAPGFDDNRGPVQDITNSIYIYHLLQKVKSLKMVLVIDINDILHDNIKPFLSVLNAVENIFRDEMNYYFRSISVIFTKVPDNLNNVPVNMEFIKEILREKILSAGELSMSDNSKDFVRFLIWNERHIGFFKRPGVGLVTSDVEVNIFGAIENAKSAKKNVLTQINPSIADSSMLYLYEAREELLSTSSFMRLQSILHDVLDFKTNKVKLIQKASDSSLISNLVSINEDLNSVKLKIYETFNITLSFHQKVGILQSIDPAIESLINKENLIEKAKLMEIVDKLLELKESDVFVINLEGILETALAKVNEAMINISLKLGEISMKQSKELMENERVRHAEEQQALRNQLMELEKYNEERKRSLFSVFEKILGFVVKKAISWFTTGNAA